MPSSSIVSLSTLLSRSLASVRSRFRNRRSDLDSFLGGSARAWAMGLFGLQRTAEAIDRESPPNAKTSDLGIITWADISGVPSNQGGYGRNGATAATGGAAPVTGTSGTQVLAGQQLVAPDGVTIVQLDADVTIPASGSFTAVTLGSGGNLEAGTVLSWLTPPTGCDDSVVLSSALTGAIDIETIDHLFGRLRDLWQAPPKGGANIDYDEWASAVAGIADAYVYPRRGGSGTVHVVITAPGSALARIPTDQVITNTQTSLDLLKPADVDEVLVMAAEMPIDRALTIRASAFLASGYEWDWDDTGGTWAVSSYSSAGPITLVVNNALPQNLKDAIDNGDQPLIQVLSTTVGAPIVAEQVRVTAYVGTTLTLQSALSVAPTIGDRVYAGAYAAPAAAAAILAFVDALGPSQESGFADAVIPWESIASVWGCGDAALRALDTDGTTRMLSRLAGVNGLTIQVGDGSPASVDFVPRDTYTVAPEIARVAHCIVIQAAA